jgi:predicted dithiol-disulfide oxidoreductase (DUF899 family)
VTALDITTTNSGVTMTGSSTQGIKTVLHPVSDLATAKAVYAGLPRARERLAELFDGRSQLLIYHFMFGPTYEAGCPVCSSIADTIDPNAVHLAAKDVTMLLVSRAPVEKLQAYKKRMAWGLDWASAGGSDFNRDLDSPTPRRSCAPSSRARSRRP